MVKLTNESERDADRQIDKQTNKEQTQRKTNRQADKRRARRERNDEKRKEITFNIERRKFSHFVCRSPMQMNIRHLRQKLLKQKM